MKSLVSKSIALLFATVGCVGAAQENSISVRCSLALAITAPELPTVAKLEHTKYISDYASVLCEDRGDVIRVSYRFSNEVLAHDGEDYFLVDAKRWVVVEKWVGGGAWLDPDYEKKILEATKKPRK